MTTNHRRLADFWEWFTKQDTRLHALPSDELVEVIYAKLAAVDETLGVLVSEPRGAREVIVTAHGNAGAADAVKAVVAAAPSLSGWRFVAFLPAAREPFVHERACGLAVASKSVLFEPLASATRPRSIGLRLFVPAAVLVHPERDAILWSLLSSAAGEELAFHVEHLDGGDIEDVTGEHLSLSDVERYLRWKLEKHRT